MPHDWDYGGAWRRVDMSGTIHLPHGSMVEVCDWTERLPEFMREADTLCVDPPWNAGNVRSFYTKAGIETEPLDFERFSRTLWDRIMEIEPETLFLEMGKQFLGLHLELSRAAFRSVTFYNSTYFRRRENKCYIIHATNGKPRRHKELEDLDEAAAIAWICANHGYACIGDLCMGRGLVGRHAYLAGRRFVGTELNPKRLAVLVEFINNNEVTHATV